MDLFCVVPKYASSELCKSIRKKGFGPEETQVALGVSRDYKDFKDKKYPGHAPKQSPLSLNWPKIHERHLKDAPKPY